MDALKGGAAAIDSSAMFKLSYGLFVLTAREDGRDNGCIINTAAQITSSPLMVSVAVNKAGFTHGMILRTGGFALSVLSESAPFSLFRRFGFQSGKDTDKFAGLAYSDRTASGARFIPEHTNAIIAAKVAQTAGFPTHTVFFADVTQALTLSAERSATYQYYFDSIKPKPPQESKKGFVCKVCGYVYEGVSLPKDFVCPLCRHGAADFEPVKQ
ncbi:MAG: flavin reductase [Oscillospiraceae bacterium]|jgi:flavin reductase (DIM6/NTAB) family NADH-FMN oxidoreductase RutF|nr:flavin reductase [Oscillospiraceae bacterium]